MSGTVTVVLDDDTIELLERLHAHTGLSAGQIVHQLLPAHANELWTYLSFLDQLPTASPLCERASYLLHNYGPRTLIEDIKQTFQLE